VVICGTDSPGWDTMKKTLPPRPFAGHGTSHVTSSNMLVAQPGDAVDIDSPTVMGQIPRRLGWDLRG